jgi:dTDP-glucose 4,6-dehydratase
MAGSEEKAVGRVLNLGSGQEISIGELARSIAEKLGKPLRVEEDRARIRPSGSEVERLLADNRLAGEVLGWKPEIGLSAGLDITIKWVEENLHRYKPEMYMV